MTPIFAIGLLGCGALLFGVRWWIRRCAGCHVIGRRTDLPRNEVGLVLGTSAFTRGRLPNPHFEHRIAAAAALFHAGAVHRLLLSGNGNGSRDDEPAEMQSALIALGVPAANLMRDGAGLRTLDSVVRAKEIFGLRRVTIITDRFHCYRAVFLARHFGLDAVGFPADPVSPKVSIKSRRREWLADVKALLDLYVLHTRPEVAIQHSELDPPGDRG